MLYLKYFYLLFFNEMFYHFTTINNNNLLNMKLFVFIKIYLNINIRK